MEELIKAFKEAEMAEYKYIGIGITEPGYIKPKIIIIPKENLILLKTLDPLDVKIYIEKEETFIKNSHKL